MRVLYANYVCKVMTVYVIVELTLSVTQRFVCFVFSVCVVWVLCECGFVVSVVCVCALCVV